MSWFSVIPVVLPPSPGLVVMVAHPVVAAPAPCPATPALPAAPKWALPDRVRDVLPDAAGTLVPHAKTQHWNHQWITPKRCIWISLNCRFWPLSLFHLVPLSESHPLELGFRLIQVVGIKVLWQGESCEHWPPHHGHKQSSPSWTLRKSGYIYIYIHTVL